MNEFTRPEPVGPAPWPQAVPFEWLAQAADALAAPMALMTVDGELLYGNAAFQRVLAAPGGPLRLQGGRLQPASLPAAKSFATRLAAAAQGQAQPLHAHTEGLTGNLVLLAATVVESKPKPAPVRLVLTLETTGAAGLDWYATHLGLTPAETRVLKGLAAGADAVQVARRFGLKTATVRGHLVNIRRKTGHTSLRALLLELANLPPLGGWGGAQGE